MQKAIFLDRDGTINVDRGYVYKFEDLEFIQGVESSLKMLQSAGYLFIIITNQSGVGRGYFSEADAHKFNRYLIDELQKKTVTITDVFMCSHAPEDKCDCRKPSPKLILEAIEKYDIDASGSFMLGDKQSDVDCGRNAGVKSYLIDEQRNIEYWTKRILNKQL
jgi:D-glycero-D-manno-heptose 1,7-bisphosphate phosphatase